DAAQYDSFNARVDLPVQIFQGERDIAVSPDTVRRWAAARPNVELHMLDDDHQLLASLDYMWRGGGRFLGVWGLASSRAVGIAVAFRCCYSSFLPTNPLVTRGHLGTLYAQPHQIDDQLVRPRPFDGVRELWRGIANDDDLGRCEHVLNRVRQQARE